MDGYQIFTDATSDLAPELTAGLPSVEMIPMNVEIGGTEYSYGSPEGMMYEEYICFCKLASSVNRALFTHFRKLLSEPFPQFACWGSIPNPL